MQAKKIGVMQQTGMKLKSVSLAGLKFPFL
jgi:hypothetical protein